MNLLYYYTSTQINSITSNPNSGTIVAVGNSGRILTGQINDALIPQVSNSSTIFRDVIYNPILQIFVAVGYQGTICYSPDGIIWTPRVVPSIPSTILFRIVTYNSVDGTFLSIGDNYIYKSVDGINWTLFYTYTHTLFGIAISSTGTIVAIASKSIITSTDNGNTWNINLQPSLYFGSIIYNTFFNLFIILGNNILLTSPDGNTWTTITTTIPIYTSITTTYKDNDITYNPNTGQTVIVAFVGGGITSRIYYSDDNLTTWNYITIDFTTAISCDYISGYFYISFYNFGLIIKTDLTSLFDLNGYLLFNSLYEPIDLTTNTINNTLFYINDFIILYNNSYYKVRGELPIEYLYNTDIINLLTKMFITPNNFILIVGQSGTILYSNIVVPNPNKYEITVGTTNLNSVIFGSVYIIVGNSGTILTNNDVNNSNTWVVQNSGITANLRDIAYNAGLYVAVGQTGTIITSTDNGVTWNTSVSTTTNILNGIIYSSIGIFVAVGSAGTILTSSNGITWVQKTSNTTKTLLGIVYSSFSKVFVAVGQSGTILSSIDGTNWILHNYNITQTFFSITYNPNNGLFLAVGDTALIVAFTIVNGSICFPKGTPVQTDQGNICIDKINPMIHTINQKRIVDITKTITKDKNLICFPKDSISKDIPNTETLISLGHKINYNGEMHPAEWFLEQFSNVKEMPYIGETLYNVLMEKHDTIIVNNLICETLNPDNPIAKFYTKQCKLSVKERDRIFGILKEMYEKNDFTSYQTLLQLC